MILVCAATGTEAAACRRGIADAGAPGFTVITTGVGPERAATALSRWLTTARATPTTEMSVAPPTLVVSSGFAGALTDGVDPLAWVTASGVHRLVEGRAVKVSLPPGLLRVAHGATACHLLSADRALTDGVSGLGHPAIVDMESAALADVAREEGIPFLVLRMITDTPARPLAAVGRSLAIAFAARDLAGRAAHGAKAAARAARSPFVALTFLRDGVRWRGLLREGWRQHASRGIGSSAV